MKLFCVGVMTVAGVMFLVYPKDYTWMSAVIINGFMAILFALDEIKDTIKKNGGVK